MTRRRRPLGRRMALAMLSAVVAFAASDVVLARVVSATQDDTLSSNYGIYNGQVSATADREQVGTTVDANFSGGAINNFYPLAQAQVATAGTNADASPADTGPFAQAVFGGGLSGHVFTQPQYVFAQYPGNENPPPFNPGTGASASASVSPASAKATAYETAALGAPPGSTSQGSPPVVAVPGQTSSASPTPPDGTDGDTGYDSVYFDSVQGFVTTGSSRVAHASFDGGTIQLDNVRVDVTITNKGDGSKPGTTISVQVGSASVAGNAVTIDQNGVVASTAAAQAQVNQVLSSAGYSLHLVTPLQTQQGDNQHVDAYGVMVDWQQPASLTPSGVPSQFIRHYLGEVLMDNEATLAAPTSALVAPVISGGGLGIVSSGGVPVAPPVSTSTPSHPSQPHAVPIFTTRLTAARPLWLLLLYLAWQALLIGTAASIYLWRSGMRLGSLTR